MGLELKIGIVGLGVKDNQLGNRIVEEMCNQNLQEGTISKLLLNKDTRNPLINDMDTVNRYINYQIKLKEFRDSGKVEYGTLEQIADECDMILFTFGAGISDTNPKTRRAMEFNNNVRTLKRICTIIESVFDHSKGYLHIVSNPTDYLVHFAREFLPNAEFNQIGGHNHVDTFRARDEFRKSLTMDEKLMNIGEHSENSFLHIRGFDKNEISQYNDVLKNVYEKMLAKGFDYLDFMGSSNLDTAKTVVDLIKGVNTNELFGISGEFEHKGNKVCVGLPRKLVTKNGVIRWEDGKTETGKTEIERILEIHSEKMEKIAENFTKRIKSTGIVCDRIDGREEKHYRWEEKKKIFIMNHNSGLSIMKARIEEERAKECKILCIDKLNNSNITLMHTKGSNLYLIDYIVSARTYSREGIYRLHRVKFIPNGETETKTNELGHTGFDLMCASDNEIFLAKKGRKKIFCALSKKEIDADKKIYSIALNRNLLFAGGDSAINVLDAENFKSLFQIPAKNGIVEEIKIYEDELCNPVIVSRLKVDDKYSLLAYDLKQNKKIAEPFECDDLFDGRHIYSDERMNFDVIYRCNSDLMQRRFPFEKNNGYVEGNASKLEIQGCGEINQLVVDAEQIYSISRNGLSKDYKSANGQFHKNALNNINGIWLFRVCEVFE